jgi:hypothetical protein
MENVISRQMETCGIYGIHIGVAGLNIAPEVPAMTMFRYILFGTVISILSKFLYEVRK